ncbi:2-acylglycerol O-acyltransferase 1 [Frankliniella fusca]|uniref:Acyltransferase n=1 Tax=Frankliniella fusca TaxID=407009 RepID=A0AAE1LQ80_9NEOP|nr:2-acylglycerol O-acyltransferase 1 [Frankliniella fusca]
MADAEREHGTVVLGVRWAPLATPLSRRLQTLVVASWIYSLFLTPWIIWLIVSICLLHPLLRCLVPLYLAWMYFDRNTCDRGGRRNGRGLDLMRGCRLWHFFRDYFPITLVKTAELPPDTNYLLCSYPHGIIGTGVLCSFGTDALKVKELFPGTTPNLVTLRQNFKLPVMRELMLSQGMISAADKSIRYALADPKKGRLVVLVVGGAAEAQLSEPGDYRIVLKRRKGFARVALQEGVPLVPVFTFNEHKLLSQLRGTWMDRVQDWARRVIGFVPVVPVGRGVFQYSFGAVPHRLPLTVVVGKPIPVQRVPEPSREQIAELMDKFEKALFELFHEHKDKYHPGEDINLIIDQ